MKSSVFAVLWAFVACGVYAVPSSHVEHESHDQHAPAHSWVKRSRLEPHLTLPVRIGLLQKNIENDHGHNLLMDISDPTSPNYGHRYSAEEIVEMFAPSQDSIDAVRSWLEAAGISNHRISLSANKQWLQFDSKTSELESLLHTTYHKYENAEDGALSVACDRYHLPKDVQPHIDFIKPGIALYSVPSRRSVADKAKREATPSTHRVASSTTINIITPSTMPFPEPVEKLKLLPPKKACYKAVTPDCVRKLYNITDTITKVTGNSIGVYESEGEFYSERNLQKFFETFADHIPQGSRPIYRAVDGAPPPHTPTEDRTEADLDFQAVYPLVYPDEIVNFQVDDYWFEEENFVKGIFNTFLDAIDGSYCNYSAFGVTGDTPGFDAVYPDAHHRGWHHKKQCGVYKPTNVISVSYGLNERALPINYQRRQCNEWMKLGLQGVSVIFASGDGGVGKNHGGCAPNGVFVAASPQNCPYVTTVGGTALPKDTAPAPGSEIAVNLFASGGGFSDIYPRPSYQEAAVKNYLDKHDPPYKYYRVKFDKSPHPKNGGRYNRIGRAFPDVSAIGQRFAGVQGGRPTLYAGTSASAPQFAAIIARINNHRIAAGKGPVGFLNPTLYAHPHMFNDVIHGRNPGCNTDGFSCAPGWDPVTGLGTPNYGKMLEVFMKLK